VKGTADIVVIGAGFAGAATAYHLTRLGVRDVLIVEQEDLPGRHASGRNAAMARQTGVPAAIAPLAREGAAFLRDPPTDLLPRPSYKGCGILLLDESRSARALHGAGWQAGLGVEWWERDEIVRRLPHLRDGAFGGGVYGRGDGVVDIAALLQGLLRAAQARGARLLTGLRVDRVASQNGRVSGVVLDDEVIASPRVVNAAGAWAGELARRSGAPPLGLVPMRRHLYVSAPLPWVDASWPIVWFASHGLYFRPEPPGLLLSPCDETPHAPGATAPDPLARAHLAEKVKRAAPALDGVALAREWACLRTLAPDGHFLLGRDPGLEGLFWCAGLGGHGMTVCAAAGRIAAEAVLGHPVPSAHAADLFHRAVLV
jgi:D-arginine dehydrogenase